MTALPADDPSLVEAFTDLPPIAETASRWRWVMRPADEAEAMAIAKQTIGDNSTIWPPIARALAARGITGASAATYLNPSLRDEMPDPFVLLDMEKATERLATAILDGETIGVFGDYDVDGATAAAILHSFVTQIGGKIETYLPDRFLEGYGPTIEAFRALKEKGASVIVTVDCGASAHEVVEKAVTEDMDVVVLDHHQMQGPPPEGAHATVNPNRPDDKSGLGGLSAAGVAFMAAVAVNRALRNAGHFADRKEPDLKALLDLTALGLVCDVMPMTGLTRTLVAQGLKVYGKSGNLGLKALGDAAGVKGKASAYHLGFLLGPRINASGRLGHAKTAFELLTTTDAAKRKALADKLHSLNAERQEVEASVQEAALAVIEKDGLADDPVIVVAGEGWHEGVIGIVAGRVKERFDKPAIVIALKDGTGKGSGRSLDGVDLGAAIVAAKDDGLLTGGGGHAMAAGLSIETDFVSRLRGFLKQRLANDVDQARMKRAKSIDAIIAASAVTGELARQIEAAGPFGPGNAEPVFMLSNVYVDSIRVVGKGHISCTLLDGPSGSARAIAFRAADDRVGEILNSGKRVHVIGKVKLDDWRGGNAAQFQIVDVAVPTVSEGLDFEHEPDRETGR